MVVECKCCARHEAGFKIMGIVLVIVAILALVLIGRARSVGKKKIWGPVTDKINQQTLEIAQETQRAAREAQQSQPQVKLPMQVVCERSSGATKSFNFEIEISESEMASIQKLIAKHSDVRDNFECLKEYDQDIYFKIRRAATKVLYDAMGEETIQEQQNKFVVWGDVDLLNGA